MPCPISLGGPLLTALVTAAGPADAPLMARDRVQLRLAGAEAIVTAAKAAEMELKVNIAVLDDGGHLLAFARMTCSARC